MKFFQKYERCRGLSFPAYGQWKLELWFAPAGYHIAEHTHDKQDIQLIPLLCHNVRFHRRKRGMLLGESFFATFRHIGKVFTINAGDSHWFEVSSWPLIFINIEKWRKGEVITSAAEDLNLTEKKEYIYGRTR